MAGYSQGSKLRASRYKNPEAVREFLQVTHKVASSKCLDKTIDWKDVFERAGLSVDSDIFKDSADIKQRDQNNSGYLTIGMIGHPNVGKPSLINGLFGRKVVSASRTPGHTKHFQTLFLCESFRICDCPGLVFPSFVPRPIQVGRVIVVHISYITIFCTTV